MNWCHPFTHPKRLILWTLVILGFVGLGTPPSGHADNPPQVQTVESDSFLVEKTGGWRKVETDEASGGAYLLSETADARLTVQFIGSSLEIIYVAAPTTGTLAVEIDGVVVRTIVTQSSTVNYGQVARFNYLEDTTHILSIYTSGGVIAIDAFVTVIPETDKTLPTNNPFAVSNTPFYYYDGQQLPLTINPAIVAVRFQEDAQTTPRLESYGIQPQSPRQVNFVSDQVSLLPIDQEAAPQTTRATIEALRQTPSPEIEWIQPVYQGPNNTQLIATDEIIVKYAADMTLDDIEALNAEYGIVLIDALPADPDVYLVRTSGNVDTLNLANRLHEHARIVYAEPNFISSIIRDGNGDPNDSFYSLQWYLNNDGSIFGSKADADINAREAWNIQTGNESIIIAILDDGVQTNHPDLSAKIVSYYDLYEGDQGPMPHSWDGHGTAVAGIAAATSNNLTGVTGVCQNCRIMPIRLFYTPAGTNTLYGDFYKMAASVDFAWQNGAAVLNNSWGSSPSTVVSEAIQRAIVNGRGGLGSVVVAAAGNVYGGAVGFPANLPNVVTVSATNWCDEVKQPQINPCNGNSGADWSFGTTYGPEVDIAAPGHSIYTTDVQNTGGFSVSDYTYFSGTSASAPIVSGVLALIIAQNPSAPRVQVESIMYNLADDVNSSVYPGKDIFLGWGRVNAFKALADWSVKTFGGTPTTYLANPEFSWDIPLSSYIQDLTAYEVYLANQQGQVIYNNVLLASDICDSTTCTAQLGLSLSAGTYTWYVRSYSVSVGYSIWSTAQFLQIFMLTQDTPRTTLNNPNGDPTFTWQNMSEFPWYELYVGNASGQIYNFWYESATQCSGLPTNCSVNPIQQNNAVPLVDGDYQWYVRGWNETSYGIWSGPIAFKLDATPPALPSLDSGFVQDTNTLRPRFVWQAPENSTYFYLYVGTSSGTQVWLAQLSRAEVCGTLDGVHCEVTIPVNLTDGNDYVAYLQSGNAGGASTTLGTPGNIAGWQGPIAFTVDVPPPALPTGLMISALNNGDVSYQWQDDPLATWFNLYIVDETSKTLIQNRWYEKNHSDLQCTNGLCEVTPHNSLKNHQYVWYVQAYGDSGTSVGGDFGNGYTLGPILDLTTLPLPSLPALDTLVPPNNATFVGQDNFTYSWADSTNAVWYQLYIADSVGIVNHQAWYRRLDICSGGTCQVGPNTPIPLNLYLQNGSYKWFVQSYGIAGYSIEVGAGGYSGWQGPATFTVGGDPQTALNLETDVNAQPSGLARIDNQPANPATNQPTFTWTPTIDSTWYELYVGSASGVTYYQQWLTAQNLDCAGGTGIVCMADPTDTNHLTLPQGDYLFYVRSYGPSGHSTWNNAVPRAFTIMVAPPAGPASLISPLDNYVFADPTLTFSWQATADTTYYGLSFYDRQGNYLSTLWYTAAQVDCVQDSTCSMTLPLGVGTYQWSVSVYGNGTVGTNYQESLRHTFTRLE